MNATKKVKINSESLIQNLIEETRKLLNQAERLKTLDWNSLNWRNSAASWSILECLEHLNLYGDFYFPQIENKIMISSSKPEIEFNSGLLGNYFAQSMLPKEKLNKMNTFKSKNPINSDLDQSVIDRFINQQIKLLDLLNKSRNVSLGEVKIQTSISSLIKLKLGDTFQFIINHNIRHLAQIDKIQAVMNNSQK